MKNILISPDSSKINWKAIAVYYVLACAISFPFFWWRHFNTDSWIDWKMIGFAKQWFIMWGVGISALVCYFLFRKSIEKTVSLGGTSWIKSLIFYFLPVFGLCIVGIEGLPFPVHIAPLVLSIVGFISILGEEIGWRGFLQDSLKNVKPLPKYLIIAVLWEFWHIFVRTSSGEWYMIIVKILAFGLGSFIISVILGKAIEKTKSLFVVVTLHAWIDILIEFGSTGTYIVFACCIPVWIYMILTWENKLTIFTSKK
ncbi:CPBP family intramembrane glutamic endopeptidase (plasmid) [Bernardetia sp. Wsw4-3y2]|uniref:CPBP family intramembrane glutamic endopeptidase n=1 Tax=Bernardetia sp. Wsw4-3y2 TaxID=3127471 RepID=UPI0030D5D465